MEKEIDLTQLNIQELKAFVYDNMSVTEKCQRNIQLANQEIAKKSVSTLQEQSQVKNEQKTK